jgi:hypothetical protein
MLYHLCLFDTIATYVAPTYRHFKGRFVEHLEMLRPSVAIGLGSAGQDRSDSFVNETAILTNIFSIFRDDQRSAALLTSRPVQL